MDVKKEIIAVLKKAVSELVQDSDIDVSLQEPKDESHGDYSSNVALVLAKQLKKNPLEVAQDLMERIKNQESRIKAIEKIEVAKPGFINFYISKDYLVDQLQEVLKEKESFGQGSGLKDKKIMVEFTDPNPFKEFHIGHLYSNTVGESLCRILESQGAMVKRVCYQGDVGLHVAKAMWGIMKHESRIMPKDDFSLQEKVKLLGQAYARGAKAYEDPSAGSGQDSAKEEINQLNKKIYDGDASVKELYEKGRQWSLDYFETIYARLGTKFTGYYFESQAGKIGLELVKKHIQDGIFEESEGAIIFPGEKYGLHTRVFVNKLGLPTYEAKELGLAPTKYKNFSYDESIIITGNEINAYFQVLLKALSLISPDLSSKTKHIGHGMVKLPTGKMSSRTGDVITGEWLLDEAKNRISQSYKEMDADTLESVAVGAVKYALLRGGIGRDISFSFDESISLEGNSGSYLQYTFARTQSVVRKANKVVILSEVKDLISVRDSSDTPQNDMMNEELALLRTLHRFPEVISEAADKYAPHIICNYLFDLAQKFNLFYQKCPILESDNKEFRLSLTQATGQVIKNGLYLLGIKSPERM